MKPSRSRWAMGRRRLWRLGKRPPRGATAMEYMILIILVAMSLIAVIELFAGGVEAQFQAVVDIIREDMGRETSGGKERRAAAKAAEREERQSSTGVVAGSEESEEGLVAAPDAPPDEAALRGSPPPSKGSVGGINPWVILICLLLLLLLGYAMFGKKKNG